MTDKPKPWFRLKLRVAECDADVYHATLLSKAVVEDVRTDWLPKELCVYGASPMIVTNVEQEALSEGN